jgi:hypothetical protein
VAFIFDRPVAGDDNMSAGFPLELVARIPGLKSETWGTHRFVRMLPDTLRDSGTSPI